MWKNIIFLNQARALRARRRHRKQMEIKDKMCLHTRIYALNCRRRGNYLKKIKINIDCERTEDRYNNNTINVNGRIQS